MSAGWSKGIWLETEPQIVGDERCLSCPPLACVWHGRCPVGGAISLYPRAPGSVSCSPSHRLSSVRLLRVIAAKAALLDLMSLLISWGLMGGLVGHSFPDWSLGADLSFCHVPGGGCGRRHGSGCRIWVWVNHFYLWLLWQPTYLVAWVRQGVWSWGRQSVRTGSPENNGVGNGGEWGGEVLLVLSV